MQRRNSLAITLPILIALLVSGGVTYADGPGAVNLAIAYYFGGPVQAQGATTGQFLQRQADGSWKGATPSAGGGTLAQTLANGNTTGGRNLVVSTGDLIELVPGLVYLGASSNQLRFTATSYAIDDVFIGTAPYQIHGSNANTIGLGEQQPLTSGLAQTIGTISFATIDNTATLQFLLSLQALNTASHLSHVHSFTVTVGAVRQNGVFSGGTPVVEDKGTTGTGVSSASFSWSGAALQITPTISGMTPDSFVANYVVINLSGATLNLP